MPWPIRKAVLAGLCHAEIADLGNEPMASLQCLDNIGFPLLLKPHLVGGSYPTLAAIAAQMNRCCELCPAELTMFRVGDLVLDCLMPQMMSQYVTRCILCHTMSFCQVRLA